MFKKQDVPGLCVVILLGLVVLFISLHPWLQSTQEVLPIQQQQVPVVSERREAQLPASAPVAESAEKVTSAPFQQPAEELTAESQPAPPDAMTITGRVLDRHGKPLADLQVHYVTQATDGAWVRGMSVSADSGGWNSGSFADALVKLKQNPIEGGNAQTNGNGEFTLIRPRVLVGNQPKPALIYAVQKIREKDFVGLGLAVKEISLPSSTETKVPDLKIGKVELLTLAREDGSPHSVDIVRRCVYLLPDGNEDPVRDALVQFFLPMPVAVPQLNGGTAGEDGVYQIIGFPLLKDVLGGGFPIKPSCKLFKDIDLAKARFGPLLKDGQGLKYVTYITGQSVPLAEHGESADKPDFKDLTLRIEPEKVGSLFRGIRVLNVPQGTQLARYELEKDGDRSSRDGGAISVPAKDGVLILPCSERTDPKFSENVPSAVHLYAKAGDKSWLVALKSNATQSEGTWLEGDFAAGVESGLFTLRGTVKLPTSLQDKYDQLAIFVAAQPKAATLEDRNVSSTQAQLVVDLQAGGEFQIAGVTPGVYAALLVPKRAIWNRTPVWVNLPIDTDYFPSYYLFEIKSDGPKEVALGLIELEKIGIKEPELLASIILYQKIDLLLEKLGSDDSAQVTDYRAEQIHAAILDLNSVLTDDVKKYPLQPLLPRLWAVFKSVQNIEHSSRTESQQSLLSLLNSLKTRIEGQR